MTEIVQPIPARLKNISIDGHVAGTEDIVDDAKGMTQQEINSSVEDAIGDDETEGTILGRIKALEEAEPSTGGVEKVKVGDTEYSPVDGTVSLPAYPTTLPASDVYDWAKAASKPSYTKSEVGLGNVTNNAQVKRSEMGAASGVATLDSAGKVPASQLPSYIDDVLEYDTKSAFPTTGEAGKIYVDKSTNTSWRWSGTTYVQIKGDLVIGTTTGTAADGGVANTHYNNTSNPHSVTKAQVGLGSVVNTGDSATPVSGGTTKFTTGGAYTELNKKVDKVSGKGLSTNDYTTDEKNKLSGIASGAEVNQNAFSNVGVKVGNTTTTVAADAKTDTVTLIQGSNVTLTADTTNDTVTIAAKDTTYSAATTSAAGLMSADDKTKLNGIAAGAEVNVQSDWNATSGDAFIKNKPTIPSEVTESTVSGWGFTKNAGTITGIKMNGASKGTSGVVDLGTVITAHQDISGKLNKSGDTMTGDLTRKCTNVDASKADNNVSSTNYPTTYNVTDNSNRILTRKEAIIESNGNISAYWYVRNYNTSGTMVGQKGIKIAMDKSGNMTYTVDDAAKFRSAIGAGTSSFSGSYNDLSNKPTIPAAAANGTYTVKTLVGSTTTNVSDFTANQSSADDVTFVQGSNVTITPDATNRKITIAATDTKYTAATAAPGKVASSSAQGSSTNYARQDHTHGIDLATGDSNGQVKIAGTNVSVKGLGSAAYTASTAYAASQQLASDANLNDIKTVGFYNAGGSNTITNKPSGVEHFGMEVIHYASGNYYVQIVYNNSNSWRRRCDNGTWDSWVQDKLTDTKDTAGTTNKTGTKMFLAAATEQSANPVTYSNSNCYIGTDNCLYSGGAKVLTSHDGNNRKSFYGTCTTAAATKDKVVTLAESAGWPGLVAGVIVGVKFTNTNSYNSATANPITLNVNSTGAKNIWFGNTHSGAGNTGTNTTAYGRANYVNYYMYDGTYWAWLSSSADNNTTYSPLSLGFCYGTCSTAAGTAAKTVTMGSYNLVTHGIVSIRFTKAITVASATLNINSKGAKAIYYKEAALGANIVGAGSTVVMQYDGSHYQIINIEAPIITTSEIDTLLAD